MTYNNRAKGFIEVYKDNIKIRRLIKNEVFKIEKSNCNLVVKITHVKPNENWSYEIDVNIKVSGTMNKYWGGSRDVKTGHFYSNIQRNRDIRNHVKSEIKNFMKLFGIQPYYVDIKKVTVCEKV